MNSAYCSVIGLGCWLITAYLQCFTEGLIHSVHAGVIKLQFAQINLKHINAPPWYFLICITVSQRLTRIKWVFTFWLTVNYQLIVSLCAWLLSSRNLYILLTLPDLMAYWRKWLRIVSDPLRRRKSFNIQQLLQAQAHFTAPRIDIE